MSISNDDRRATDFDRWIATEFAQAGAFTVLVVLLEIGSRRVTPLCSTYFNVIGEEVDWEEIKVMFAGSGANWDAASFFPVTSPDGTPLDNPTARGRLRALEARLDQDLLVLNEGHFFDRKGRRLKIEEVGRE